MCNLHFCQIVLARRPFTPGGLSDRNVASPSCFSASRLHLASDQIQENRRHLTEILFAVSFLLLRTNRTF